MIPQHTLIRFFVLFSRLVLAGDDGPFAYEFAVVLKQRRSGTDEAVVVLGVQGSCFVVSDGV
jgi:hypothetical protein